MFQVVRALRSLGSLRGESQSQASVVVFGSGRFPVSGFREWCLQILGLPRVRLALSRYGQRRTVSVAQLSPAILLFSRGFQVRWIGELGLRSRAGLGSSRSLVLLRARRGLRWLRHIFVPWML